MFLSDFSAPVSRASTACSSSSGRRAGSHRGLENDLGDNHCFLNVVIQVGEVKLVGKYAGKTVKLDDVVGDVGLANDMMLPTEIHNFLVVLRQYERYFSPLTGLLESAVLSKVVVTCPVA